jgi:hypothetical protein
MQSRNKRIAIALAGVAGLALSLPAIGQRAPESLLPPGFGESQPAPAPTATPTPGAPGPTSLLPPGTLPTEEVSTGDELAGDEADEEKKDEPVELPDAARRPIDVVGPLTDDNGGLGEQAFARANGLFLTRLMRRIDAPVASRWVSILLRRALLTHAPTPPDVEATDWIAERAWLLLRMGEADAARMLIESVDTDRLSPKLIVVGQQIALATADPSALCRLTSGAAAFSKDKSWDYARAICASLTGEGAVSSLLLDQARGKARRNIDFLLAEKVIGAGANTRRSAMIEWADADRLTTWRFGLASTVGLAIPEELYATVGPHVQAWRARAPMFHAEDRLKPAAIAATLGVFSNAALVDLYSEAAEGEGDVGRDAPTALLRAAYIADDDDARMSAILQLWSDADDKPGGAYAFEILTARAAARLKPSDSFSSDYAKLIASMLSAGLDIQAARWGALVEANGASDNAWALLAVGAPRRVVGISASRVESYASGLGSEGAHKTRLLIAALGGLGRLSSAELTQLGEDYELPLARENRYTRILDRAAARGEQGTVAVLAAAGMQTGNWKYVPPVYLYHIVAALKRTGNEPVARMIAAEALSRA